MDQKKKRKNIERKKERKETATVSNCTIAMPIDMHSFVYEYTNLYLCVHFVYNFAFINPFTARDYKPSV